MNTATYDIEVTGISEETLRLLDERVSHLGGDRSGYVRNVLDKDLRNPTLSDLLAPFRHQVAESGMSEQELDDLFSEAREEVFHQRTGQHKRAAITRGFP